MPPTLSPTPPTALAATVLAKLEVLHGALEAAVNPHRLALRHLGMVDVFSGTKVPYNDDAFTIWNDLCRRNPDDWESLHHLAIMHHARAMDLESSANPGQSDSDWKRAVELWHRLWQADVFWERMAAGTVKTISADVWRSVRAQLPVLHLTIHYDIAFDLEHTKIHRAKFHLVLAHGTSYPAEAREAVQRDVYTRFVSVIPPNVWQFEETNPDTIKLGMDRIEQFLKLDPACVPALEDAVRLQARSLRAWCTDLQALGDDSSKRTQLLQAVKEAAGCWRPYFDQMSTLSALDEEVRQKLGLWYRLMGDIHCALGQHETSLGFYAQGIKSTQPEDEEHQRCTDELVEMQAVVARDLAHEEKPNAKSYCDELRKRSDLTITAHYILANAYLLLDEFDTADAVCDRGLSIQPRLNDIDEIEKNARDRERLEEMRTKSKGARRAFQAKKLLDEGVELLHGDQPQQAIEAFNRASSIAPEVGMVYFLRAQCNLRLRQVDPARQDLATFRRLVTDSAEADQAAAKLENDINQVAAQFARFGVEGHKLRQEAIAAANSENFNHAAFLLRQVLAQCPPAGQADVRKELALVLTNGAINQVNKAMGSTSLSFLSRTVSIKSVCSAAMASLREAAQLDPRNARIKKAIEDLQGMTNRS